MPSNEQKVAFVFANCAGAAREEDPDPMTLGKLLMEKLLDGNVVAIGLSEVIISSTKVEALPKCIWPMLKQLLPFAGGANIILNDLAAFETGYGCRSTTKYYLSHLNSQDHNHPDALKKKWSGEKSSPRIAEQFDLGNGVYQGTGALLFRPCENQISLQLRPTGIDPDMSKGIDNPLDYLGNRDTEPRSAIIFRELRVTNELTVDIAFFQLETNSNDKRVASEDAVDARKDMEGIGTDHRIEQIDKLCSALNNTPDRPIILMGDFNARPGTKELDHLCNKYGFLQVLPENTPSGTVRPNYSQTEQAQGWPYSHLKHKILIDHALVKGLDHNKWNCALQVIEFTDRVSDHNPIVLTISNKEHKQE